MREVLTKQGNRKNIAIAERDIENLFLRKVSISTVICSGFILLQFIDLKHLICYTTGDEVRMAYTGLNIIKFAMSAETVARTRIDSTGGINCNSQSQAAFIDQSLYSFSISI